MSTKTTKKSNGNNDLKELRNEVLAMEGQTSNSDVREALRGVVEKIESHQNR